MARRKKNHFSYQLPTSMRVPLYQRNQINLKQKANSILCESVKVTQNSALAENSYKRLAPF